MIGVPRDHHLGLQPGSRDAFIDELRRHLLLHQGFAAIANPFTANMAINAEHVRRVV